jgi:hypothetical protein
MGSVFNMGTRDYLSALRTGLNFKIGDTKAGAIMNGGFGLVDGITGLATSGGGIAGLRAGLGLAQTVAGIAPIKGPAGQILNTALTAASIATDMFPDKPKPEKPAEEKPDEKPAAKPAEGKDPAPLDSRPIGDGTAALAPGGSPQNADLLAAAREPLPLDSRPIGGIGTLAPNVAPQNAGLLTPAPLLPQPPDLPVTNGLPQGFLDSLPKTQIEALPPPPPAVFKPVPAEPLPSLPLPPALPVTNGLSQAFLDSLPKTSIEALPPPPALAPEQFKPTAATAPDGAVKIAAPVALKPQADVPTYADATKVNGTNAIAYDNGETKVGGAIPWRNNNPGNIMGGKGSDWASNHGAIGVDSKGYAIFPSPDAGNQALDQLLAGKDYQKLDLKSAVTRYAPPEDPKTHEVLNDTPKYIAFLVKNTGVSETTKLSDFTPSQMQAYKNWIKVMEGGNVKPGTVIAKK